MKRAFVLQIIAIIASATSVSSLFAQRHMPLAIFIDKGNIESAKIGGPIVQELAMLLASRSAIALVDINLLDVLVTRIGILGAEKPDIFLDKTKSKSAYRMYALKNSPWILFVPNDISIDRCFKEENLEDFTKMIPATTQKLQMKLGYSKLKKILTDMKKHWNTSFNIKDFDRLFFIRTDREAKELLMGKTIYVYDPKYPNDPIWDIVWSGHGSRNEAVGGLNFKQEALPLINFINKNLNVGVLYISSCYTSGKIDKIALQETINKDIQQYTLNFVLIIEGFLNQATLSSDKIDDINYEKFFDISARYGDGASIQDVILGFKGDYSGQMAQSVIQIWFPREARPRVIEIDYHTRVISKVEAIAAAANKKPIMVNVLRSNLKQQSEIANVVIYPSAIATTLMVERTKSKQLTEDLIFKNAYVPDAIAMAQQMFPAIEKYLKAENLTVTSLPNMKNNFPHVYYFVDQFLNKNDKAFSLEVFNSENRYPNFLVAHDNPQWIEQVALPKSDTYGGVFNFLSQAFIANAFTDKEYVYLVDKLSGNNDLSLLLELARFKVSQESKHPLEAALLTYGKSGEVALENVIVKTAYALKLKKPALIRIMFKLGNNAWSFEYKNARESFNDRAHPGEWQIEQVDVQQLLNQYQEYKTRAMSSIDQ